MALVVTLNSGQTVSSAFTLPRGERAFAIECPSNGTACGVQVAFSSTSGTPPFNVLQRDDGSGALAVHSGGGNAVGIVFTPPFPWGRIVLSAAPSAVMSYQITELANR
jgi:hypothetical protein